MSFSLSPLLPPSDLNSEETRTDSFPSRKRKRVLLICLLGFASFLFILAFFISLFLFKTGAFKHVVRDVRIVNGSVIEPNTKIAFPLHRKQTLEGTPGPERLVGLFLKAKHVPELHASLRVFVLAMYVDRTQARRVLANHETCPHKNQEPQEFESFVNLMNAGQITVTVLYRMVMTTPGSRMQSSWLQSLVEIWNSYNLPLERVESLKSCFNTWFEKRGFKNEDVDVLEFNSRTKMTYAEANSKKLPSCKDPLFGKAFVTHEFLENGELIMDLLPTLWNEEYDDDE